jgi:hypothetical protein
MDDRLLARKMATWLEANLRNSTAGTDLEKASGYSDNRLRQKFYGAPGETPASYLRKGRLTEAAKDESGRGSAGTSRILKFTVPFAESGPRSAEARTGATSPLSSPIHKRLIRFWSVPRETAPLGRRGGVGRAYPTRSKRSRFITLSQAATKSLTNLGFELS